MNNINIIAVGSGISNIKQYIDSLRDNNIPVCEELLKIEDGQKIGNKLFFWVCPVCGNNNDPMTICACGNKDYDMNHMWIAPRSSMTEDMRRSVLVAINSVYGLPNSKNVDEFTAELDYDGYEPYLFSWDKREYKNGSK